MIEDAVAKLEQQCIDEAKEKQESLLSLVNKKVEKIANDYLIKNQHTQIYTLPKNKQEYHKSIVKVIILDKFLRYLETI